jgi:L-lactate dehydrogenase complex protein LldG
MTARDDILSAIRAARPLEDPSPFAHDYRTTTGLDHDGLIAHLSARLTDYGVTVSRVANFAGLPGLAAARFAARSLAHIVVPPGLPHAWRPPGLREDDGLSPQQLNEAEGAMTGCVLAIAESGTIVLDGGALSGRRALTLLPDYHLCIVQTDQIVGLLPEAMPALSRAVAAGPVTFFSGPSATADIELERVQGVHGPRTLDVILAGP